MLAAHHKSIIFLPVAFAIFLMIISDANPHGVGNTMQILAGNYTVELGHDPQALVAKTKSIISLSIHDVKENPIGIDELYVRISQGNDIVFASGNLKLSADKPLYIVYRFESAENYTLDVAGTYRRADEISLEDKISASFNISVIDENTNIDSLPAHEYNMKDASQIVALPAPMLALTVLAIVSIALGLYFYKHCKK